MAHIVLENYTVPYSELLRAIGTYLDQSKLSEIRLLETDTGLILQGRVLEGPAAGERETYELTLEDLKALIEDARAKRGKKM
jgi:hypothetical protein